MTQNYFDQDIGDLGSAATTVAPVQDRSVLLQEQADLRQAQDTANDFSTLANGIFAIAPVVKEVAANRYVQKHVVGKAGDGTPSNSQQGIQQSQREKADAAIGIEVQQNQRIAYQDIATLRGLEEARVSGSISFDEMQIRAETIRREAIDRAPIFKDEINATFRSIVGTSTGTSSLTKAASPWTMTPEEVAVIEERKANAKFALELNTDLQTADKYRQDVAYAELQTKLAPKTDSEYTAWSNGMILQSRVQMDGVILSLADENGAFPTEAQPQIRNMVNQWENQAAMQLQAQLTDMQGQGILPSAAVIEKAQAGIKANADAMRKLVTDNDLTAYVQGIRDTTSAKIDSYIYETFPAVEVAKRVNVDLVDLQLRLTENLKFSGAVDRSPALSSFRDLLGMQGSDFSFMVSSSVLPTLTGTDTGVSTNPVATEDGKRSAIAAMLNANADISGDVYSIVLEAGTLAEVETTIERAPSAVVHLKNRDMMLTAPNTEQTTAIFEAAARGIDGSIYLRNPIAQYALWVDKNGKVRMEGEGLDAVVKGQAQDLYDTILANPDTWEANHSSPIQYMQEMFPNRTYTVTDQTTDAINMFTTITQPAQLVRSITENIDNATNTIEDVEAVSGMLNDQLTRAITLPFSERMKIQQDIINTQNKLWSAWDKKIENDANN